MEEWTTIDRKMSKKKTSRDEGKEEGDGWEQVGHINLDDCPCEFRQ